MDDTKKIGQGFSSLGQKLGKGLGEEAKKAGSTLVQQIGFETHPAEKIDAQKIEAKAGNRAEQTKSPANTDASNTDFLKSLYEPTQAQKPQISNNQEDATKYASKTTQEVAQIKRLEQKLFKETYYDPTFNRPQPQEEKVAERLERKEKEDEQMEFIKQQKRKKIIKPGATRQEVSAESKIGAKKLG